MKSLFENYILIDFQNLLWRTWMVKTGQELTRSDGYPSGHVFRFFKSLAKIRKENIGELCFFLEGGEEDRYNIFPEYKKGRNKEKSFDPGPDILTMISYMKCKVITPEKAEADDGIASFIKQKYKARHCIISADKDLWALYSPKIRIISFQNEITGQTIQETFKVTPDKIPLVKSLKGDPSDGIPSVPRLRWNDIEDVMQNCTTPEDLYSNLSSIKEKTREKLLSYKEQVHQMYKVAKLKENCILNVKDYEGNPEELENFIKVFECNSLVEQIKILL